MRVSRDEIAVEYLKDRAGEAIARAYRAYMADAEEVLIASIVEASDAIDELRELGEAEALEISTRYRVLIEHLRSSSKSAILSTVLRLERGARMLSRARGGDG